MEENVRDLPLLKLTAGQILEDIDEKSLSVTPETTIHEALLRMLEKGFGAVLVMEGDDVRGIWTERDLMRDVVQAGFDAGKAQIKDHMSTDLHYASWNDTVLVLLDNFFGHRIRHLLIERDGKFQGVLSAGAVVRAGLTERTKQLRELNAMVSWEFYEDWKWNRKKKKEGE